MSQAGKAPALLRTIAWLSIAMGALMALSSFMGLWVAAAAPAAMPQAMAQASALLGSGVDTNGMNAVADQAMSLLSYLRWLAIAQLPLAALVLWSGIDLLRLRPWARTANEAFCWLTLLFLALYALYALWQWLWPAAAPQAGDMQELVGIDMAGLRTMMFVVEIVVLAVFAFPTLAMLRYLRGPQARAAVAGR